TGMYYLFSGSDEYNNCLAVLEQWHLTDEEKASLLGLTLGRALEENQEDNNPQENMAGAAERMALAISINQSLNILYSDNSLIRNWLRSPNSHEMFNGSTPLTFMCNGSIQSLQSIAALLAAWSAGNY